MPYLIITIPYIVQAVIIITIIVPDLSGRKLEASSLSTCSRLHLAGSGEPALSAVKALGPTAFFSKRL